MDKAVCGSVLNTQNPIKTESFKFAFQLPWEQNNLILAKKTVLKMFVLALYMRFFSSFTEANCTFVHPIDKNNIHVNATLWCLLTAYRKRTHLVALSNEKKKPKQSNRKFDDKHFGMDFIYPDCSGGHKSFSTCQKEAMHSHWLL